ncbi:hypothetical protein JB92DRAFT_2888970 [Gautieria morchelliformis]|nr:hypothetical protein JB92DRAFT_2888970 [Gautieria morchelliformis]
MTSDFEVNLEDRYKGAEINIGSIHHLCVISALMITLSMPIPILPSAFISLSCDPATRYPIHNQRILCDHFRGSAAASNSHSRRIPRARSAHAVLHAQRLCGPCALPRAASSCLRARATRSRTGRQATSLYVSWVGRRRAVSGRGRRV